MDPTWREPLGILAELLEARLDDPHLVGLVIDREARLEPEPGCLGAQDPAAGRMEGEDPDRPRHPAEHVLEALAHLSRGLVRERDREDLVWLDAVRPDEMGDAMREHPRLPRACPGNDEQRPVEMQHRLALGGIEVGEKPLMRRGAHHSMLDD